MGAEWFEVVAYGDIPEEAFVDAVDQARYDYGHRGYTGTIAEKSDYTLVKKSEDEEAYDFSERTGIGDDKWGPCCCAKIGDKKYLFFGWSPC